jgi:hypothetical protein
MSLNKKKRLNYFPFGMVQPNEDNLSGNYKYGYNTQESVDEISGEGNHYTALYWEYNPRVIHRWNTDPIVKSWESPYMINHGNPIYYLDPDGADGKSRAQKYQKKHGGELEQLPSGAWSVQQGIPGGVSAKVFRDNIFDKIGKGVVKGLYNADAWIARTKGNSYGEGEDWIKSFGVRGKGTFDFNKYRLKTEAGIYSTNENNAGLYFNLSYRVGVEKNIVNGENNAASFTPKPSVSVGFGASSTDEFTGQNGIHISTYGQVQATGSIPGTPVSITNTTKIQLDNGDISNKTEVDATARPSNDVKIGTFFEVKFQQSSGTVNLQGGN